MGICVDFQKCVDLRRFFSFVGLYQSRQVFFYDDAHKGGDPAPWKTAFYIVDAVVVALILLGAVLIWLNYRKKSKKA